MPFYFAWVDSTDNTFTDAMKRMDEDIFSSEYKHDEGQIPTLALEILNPKVGLLSVGRKVWAWWAWDDGATVHPLFFGRLVGVPTDILNEVITLQFVARADDLLSQKFALAQTLKVRPYYDEIWLSLAKQSDPDAILEGYSARYHFDPTTLRVTISDILVGEDGLIEFTGADAFYDSVKIKIGKSALQAVQMKANIGWTQIDTGTIDLGVRNLRSYSGDGILGDWPKPFTELGAGWAAASASAYDVYDVTHLGTASYTSNWQNREETHEDGDEISNQESRSMPALLGPYWSAYLTYGGYSVNGDPETGTAPEAAVEFTDIFVPQWNIQTYLELRYDASRPRTEEINFTLFADVQALLTAPTNDDNTEQITLSGLGVDLATRRTAILTSSGVNVSNGDTVTIASTVYTFQSTLTAGAGHVHIGANAAASLNNLANAINRNDIGLAGTDFSQANTASSDVTALASGLTVTVSALDVATIVLISAAASSLTWTAPHAFTLRATANVIDGNTVTVADKTYTFRDELTVTPPDNRQFLGQIAYEIWIGVEIGQSLQRLAAAINASGGAGTDYANGTLRNESAIADVSTLGDELTVGPRFAGSSFAVGETSASLTWSNEIAELVADADTIPLVTPSRRSYFPTDRGLWSVEALIARGRAHLRQRSRAVTVSFECPFDRAIGLTCRHSVRLFDSRLPGGQAEGKVTSVGLKVNGDKGELIGQVTFECAIGNGNALSLDDGTPSYAEDSYIDAGYQFVDGEQVPLDPADVGYSVPLDAASDDGLVFPLTKAQAVVRESIRYGAIQSEVLLDQQAQAIDLQEQRLTENYFDPLGSFNGVDDPQQQLARQIRAFAKSLTLHHLWYELELKPVNNGPFAAKYDLTTSLQMLPKQIDLAASS